MLAELALPRRSRGRWPKAGWGVAEQQDGWYYGAAPVNPYSSAFLRHLRCGPRFPGASVRPVQHGACADETVVLPAQARADARMRPVVRAGDEAGASEKGLHERQGQLRPEPERRAAPHPAFGHLPRRSRGRLTPSRLAFF
jgi:hypothetical protein